MGRITALVAALAAALSVAASAASAATSVYDHNGALLLTLGAAQGGTWKYGAADDCWIQQSARSVIVGRARDAYGRAARVTPVRWNVYAGAQLRATVIRAGASRWTIATHGRLLGTVRGPDGPAAATAALLVGRCN